MDWIPISNKGTHFISFSSYTFTKKKISVPLIFLKPDFLHGFMGDNLKNSPSKPIEDNEIYDALKS